MEESKLNKIKTYVVVMIFILIIVLSAYIVIKKVSTGNNEKEESVVVKEKVLDNSSNKLELSLKNKTVKSLFDLVNDNSIDYLSYSYRNKKLDWDIKSYITVKNISEDDIDGIYIPSELFINKYKSIFNEIENLILDSDECGSASFDQENDRYVINEYCNFNKSNKYIQTYLKDIVMEENQVKIKKYYAFILKDDDGYNIYSEINTDEAHLIALDVPVISISNYVDKMNILTYNFKKGTDNNYYLDSIK